jgi:hypothetical protein
MTPDQIASATPDQQREVLEGLWLAHHHGGYPPEGAHDTCRKCARFTAMLDCRAYESAVLMLVPDKYRDDWILSCYGSYGAYLAPDPMYFSEGYADAIGYGATAALALAAAIAKAGEV